MPTNHIDILTVLSISCIFLSGECWSHYVFYNFKCCWNFCSRTCNICLKIIFQDSHRGIKMTWKQVNLVLICSGVQDLTLQEAETIALSILKQVMEEKVKLKPNACYFQLFVPLLWINSNLFLLYFHIRSLPTTLTLPGLLQRIIFIPRLRWKLW